MSDPKQGANPHKQNDATDTTAKGQESPKINQFDRSQAPRQEASPTISQFNRKGEANEVPLEEFRTIAEFATGQSEVKKDFSQHRAADKWEDYSFKNLAKGNLDDTNIPRANKFNDFVNTRSSIFSSERGGVQTPEKANLSRTATIQKSHPALEKNAVKNEVKTYNYDVPVEKEMAEGFKSSNSITDFFKRGYSSIGGFERNYILPVDPNYRKVGHAGLTTAAFLASLKTTKGLVPALKVAGLTGLISGLIINPEFFNPVLSKPMYHKPS